MALQHLRSSTAHKRPIPSVMSAGQIAINTNEGSPGLFFKDSNGDLVKVGPVHIGTSAPNSSPDSIAATALVTGTVYQILTAGDTDFTLVGAADSDVGTVFTATGAGTGTGTVSGQQGNEKGEQWLDTTGGAYDLKIYDGTAWRSQAGEFVNATGDTLTGALLLDNATSASAPDLSFDGDADTGIYSPGADQFGIATAGTSRVVVDANGEIGIGNTSPDQTIDITDATPTARFACTGQTAARIFLESDRDSSNALLGRVTGQWDDTDVASIFFRTGSDTVNKDDGVITFGTASEGTVTEAMRIDNTGNVGIGHTDPPEELSVNGDIGLYSGTTEYGKLFNDSSVLHLRAAANMELALGTEATEHVRLDSAGRLGVGLTPSSTASITNVNAGLIQTDGNIDIRYPGTNTDPAGARYLNFINSDTTLVAGQPLGGMNWIGNDANNPAENMASIVAYTTANTGTTASITFNNNDIERMRLDGAGRFLVGGTTSVLTSNEHNAIQVQGTDQASGRISIQRVSDDAGGAGIHLAKSRGSDFTIVDDDDQVGIIAFNAADGTNYGGQVANIQCQIDGAPGEDDLPGRLTFNTSSDGSVAPTERMRIQSDGKVFIGTTTPIGNQGSDIFHLGYASGPGMAFGRNDTSVAGGNDIGKLRFFSNATDGNWDEVARFIVEADGSYGNTNKPTRMMFMVAGTSQSAPTERMRVTENGLQINTTEDVSVSYASGATDLVVGSESGSNGITICAGNTSDSSIFFADDGSNGHLVGAIKYDHSDDHLIFRTSGTDGAFFDEQGRLIIGSGSAATTSSNHLLQLVSLNSVPSLNLVRNDNSVSTDNGIGQLLFYSNDNADHQLCAYIKAVADGTFTNNDKPTRLIFGTSKDGTGGAVEHMQIDNQGRVGIGSDDPEQLLQVESGSSPTIYIKSNVATVNSFSRLEFANGANNTSAKSRIKSYRLNATNASTALGFETTTTAGTTTERMRIHAQGTVSVGNSTSETNVDLLVGGGSDAVHKFKVYGSDTTSAPFIGMGYDGSAGVLTAGHSGSGSCPLVLRVAASGTESEVMRFTSDRNVLINTTSAFAAEVGAHLQIQGNSNGRTPAIALMRNDTSVVGGNSLAQIHAYSDDGNVPENCASLRFTASQTHTATARGAYASIFTTKSGVVGSIERFRFEHNGLFRSFGDGTSAAVFRTSRTSNTENAISVVKGATSVAATGSTVFTVKAGDGDVENVNGRISSISDIKLKENIVDANSQWDDIKAVRMRNYNFKAETGYETTTMLGVVAQEIEQVMPGLVKTSPDLDEDGNDLGTTTKSVAYSLLYMKSVKALQEAMARIESLEAKVAALEAGN